MNHLYLEKIHISLRKNVNKSKHSKYGFDNENAIVSDIHTKMFRQLTK